MIKIKAHAIRLLVLYFFLIFPSGILLSQTNTTQISTKLSPVFHYDLVTVDSPEQGMSRFYIYAKVPFDELTFVREDTSFRAKYELSLIVADKKNFQVDGKVWQEEVVVQTFEQTNLRKMFSFTYEIFDLPPEEYKLTIGFSDLESKTTRTVKKKIKLTNYRDNNLSVSEVAFVRNLEIDSLGVKSFSPEVADYLLDLSNKLHAYFEIYSKSKKNETYNISYTIKNAKNKKIYEDNYKRRSDGARTLGYFTLAERNLSQGMYELELKIMQGKNKCKTTKKFVVRWANLPSTISDIETAIKQLKYIAKKKEWDALKKSSPDEKLTEFKKFWDRRDPSPGTDNNERMDEYYNRVAFANANYSGFREGWKSDMGMIFIIFGPPSDIERHPFDSESKPYEIWYYYQINRNFLFMDNTGFGDYRLMTRSWEDWRSLIRY